MSLRFTQRYRHLAQLYQDRVLILLLRHLARTALSVLYSRQVQYITLRRLNRPDTATAAGSRAAERLETECVVVDSPPALAALAQEFPASFRDSVGALTQRVGQGCVVVLARHPQPEGTTKEIIGYTLAERGIFSAFGRRKVLSSEAVFAHHTEVLPSYRGQRVSALLLATRDEYFWQQGVKVSYGVIAVQNRSSLQAFGRLGSTIVGTVQRLSLLGGLLAWETPWEEIERALGVSGQQASPLESQQK